MSGERLSGPTGKQQPFWRRPRRLRRQLAGVQVATALLTLLLVGGLNFVAAGRLLKTGAAEQLVRAGESRAASIELGINGLLDDVSATAADLAVVDALTRFDAAHFALAGEELDSEQQDALELFYQDSLIAPIEEAGLASLSLDDVLPQSVAGRYLQYHYLIAPLAAGRDGLSIVDANDGSEFSEVHQSIHPFFVDLFGPTVSDVLLVSAQTGEIVYSVNKSIDFATNLADGPHKSTALAAAVLETLPTVRPGEAVLADYEIYIPSGGEPTLFVTAAVQNETEVIGALVFRVPITALDAITTANQRWDDVGLGRGESYVVGSDRVLRSASRRWLEDSEGYLRLVDDEELSNLITIFDSPVGVQMVDTEPVRTALAGGRFEGDSRNYLGEPTLAFARELEIGGLRWVVVAERPRSDVFGPLSGYAITLAILLAVLVPAAGIGGFVLVDRLAKSIPDVVSMAEEIADGARDVSPPLLGKNEFGDLARRLGQMSVELDDQESALVREHERRQALLASTMPLRIVEQRDDPDNFGETVGRRTVVSVSVSVDTSSEPADADHILSTFAAEVDLLIEALDVERIRNGADLSLFVAGNGGADNGAVTALEFVTQIGLVARKIAALSDEPFLFRVGVATGEVATGLIVRGPLTFNAWGDAVSRAQAIGALPLAAEILVDDSTRRLLPPQDWDLVVANDVAAVEGQPTQTYKLVLPTPADQQGMGT